MGTHPIFESDFDCLTEWQKRKLLVKEPTRMETTGHLTMMGHSITIIQMAAHLLKVELTKTTLLHQGMTDGTTMPTLANSPAENIIATPTTDMVNKSDTFKLSRSLL